MATKKKTIQSQPPSPAYTASTNTTGLSYPTQSNAIDTPPALKVIKPSSGNNAAAPAPSMAIQIVPKPSPGMGTVAPPNTPVASTIAPQIAAQIPQAPAQPQQPNNIQASTVFNPDNTVSVTNNGKTTKMTRQEYESYVSSEMGRGNKGVNDVATQQAGINAQATDFQLQAAAQLKQLATENQIKKYVADSIKAGVPLAEIANTVAASAAQQTTENAQIPTTEQTLAKEAAITAGEGSIFQVPNVKPGFAGAKEQLSVIPQQVLGTAGEVLSGLWSWASGRKPPAQSEAEQTFSQAMTQMSQDISLVKQGLKDPAEVMTDFEQAALAINRLDGWQKGIGKANLRYWATGGGKEIEADIIIMKQGMDAKRAELIQAQQQYNLAQATANYGT